MATSIMLSCWPRVQCNAYQAGPFGVVKEGAFILVNGNPLENIDLVADPAKNFDVIMKDGKIYKNTL
jgi:imidazolonepropionase-like amidohydrolase